MARFHPLIIMIAALALAGCDRSAPISGPPADLSPTLSRGSPQGTDVSEIEFTGRYLIIGRGGRLPSNLGALLAAAGGSLVRTIPEIGVAVATADSPRFEQNARGIAGIEAVAPDMMLRWTDASIGRADTEVVAEIGGGVGAEGHIGSTAFFGSFQWAPGAVQAPEAWHEGYTGKGVRVAILDGAIWDQHLDLAPNLDAAASVSFVPGTAFNEDLGTFWHGTHVAGIVAATGNIGTVGIAPEATLVGVKVLHGGEGAFEWILDGIVYAANPVASGGAGAHIINMSLGATIDLSPWSASKAFRDAVRNLSMALDRAMRFASQEGVTIISSAGNLATNLDVHRDLLKLPAQSQHVISVAATGPHGWALGATDFERPAYYTDHGKSLVDVAAPGGTVGLFVIDGFDDICTVHGTFTSLTQFCETFDMVFSTVRGTTVASYSWAQGTSMAAPLVAGIAALIIERNGGSMNPLALGAALKRSAEDVGKRGNDEFYGHGWVNALRAVK